MAEAGRFITLEGGEGAGKTTQISALAGHLRLQGITVTTTREPGGSPGAEIIRKLLVEGDPGRWDAHTEMLLHFAARRDHLVRTIWPALERGDWVISDRFADSTMAYQGYGHGLGAKTVQDVYTATVGKFAPDATIFLDIDVTGGMTRAHTNSGIEDRYERMDQAFHERVRAGFHAIVQAQPDRCVLIDAALPPGQVTEALCAAVDERLSGYYPAP